MYRNSDLCLINAEWDWRAVTGKLQKDSELQHFNCIIITLIFLSQLLVSLQFYGCSETQLRD